MHVEDVGPEVRPRLHEARHLALPRLDSEPAQEGASRGRGAGPSRRLETAFPVPFVGSEPEGRIAEKPGGAPNDADRNEATEEGDGPVVSGSGTRPEDEEEHDAE